MVAERRSGRTIHRAISDLPETVVIDLSETRFLDSAVVHCMLRAQHHATARSVRLHIIPALPDVHRVFTLCGVDATLPFTAAS